MFDGSMATSTSGRADARTRRAPCAGKQVAPEASGATRMTTDSRRSIADAMRPEDFAPAWRYDALPDHTAIVAVGVIIAAPVITPPVARANPKPEWANLDA